MTVPRILPASLVVLLLGLAYMVASTVVLSTDSWGNGPPSKPKGITISIEKSIRKEPSHGDHWASNPWANPWPSNPWQSSWWSGSGGKFSKEIVISKSWGNEPSWGSSGWKKSWPSDGWKSGKEISISIGASHGDSWEPPSPWAAGSSSWGNPWNSWNSWDPWKSSRVKIKPEAQEVHSGDALVREHRNSNLGINGYVQFLQYNDYVEVNGIICNLPPGKHAFHIHTFGEISNGCQDTLGDYNPYHVEHGAPDHKIRHLGDLGNIEANSTGIARFKFTDKQIRVYDRVRGIIGRSIVIHEFEDDFGEGKSKESKRNGNSGGRLACGVIGISQPSNYGTLPFTCNRKN